MRRLLICNSALRIGIRESARDHDVKGEFARDFLGDLGLIKQAHLIAGIARQLGLAVMLAAYAWGAALLYFQFRNCGSDAMEEDS